jgi:CheY-like chemotaxis protein
MAGGQPVIIAMTAFAGQDDKDACKDAGMDDYISKPIITDDLESMIMKWSPKNDSGMRNKTTVR